MGFVTMQARPFNIDHRIDEVDPTCLLYLPLYKLPGEVFYSRDRGWQKATNFGAIWSPRGRLFDGVDDYIDLGAAPTLDFTAGSFTIIHRLAGALTADNQIAFMRGDAVDNYYATATRNDGLFRLFARKTGQATSLANSLASFGPGQLITCGVSVDNGIPILYVDGRDRTSLRPATEFPSSNNGPARLGTHPNNPGGTSAYGGTMRWLAIWNRALSAQEHANIYLATKGAD